MGVNSADGIGVHPAAFKGTVNAAISGFTADVGVIAVDDKVYLAIGGSDYSEADPSRYNAPGPAVLTATAGGTPALLTRAPDPTAGKARRGGAQHRRALPKYTGPQPGPPRPRPAPQTRDTPKQ